MTISPQPWWKSANVYQIYPASFKDSNGDGIGDIPGIISELDHIKSLGMDVVWICPMYDSPQYDMGYDISDYEAVYPPYGTVQDMEKLAEECHARGMRLILDLVINHTSHLHEWFKESRSSKTNPKRDWYIWKPPKYDADGNRKPPTNWRGFFGGSVWEWDEETQEYYLHLFCKEQPDLNWENDETRQAIYESAMEFWLKKGVDGFRIDTVNMYSKDTTYPDAPMTDPGSDWQFAGDMICNGPRMHEFLSEMNAVMDKYDAMTVGELPHTPDLSRVLRYVSAREKQLNMVFQFDVVDIGQGKGLKYDTVPKDWRLSELKDAFKRTQEILEGTDAWTTVFIENHDQARSISRFGSDKSPEHIDRSGKMLATLLTTLSGTLYIYQGQEIGMVNVPEDWPMEEYKDVEALSYWNEVRERTNNDPEALKKAKDAMQHLGRDNARIPMQWDSSFNAGFTSSKTPWMRVHDNYPEINVARQAGEKNSVLAFWKKMLRMRKQHADLFIHGHFSTHDDHNEKTFVYTKTAKGGATALVMLNFTEEEVEIEVPEEVQGKMLTLVSSNYDSDKPGVLRTLEGKVYLVG